MSVKTTPRLNERARDASLMHGSTNATAHFETVGLPNDLPGGHCCPSCGSVREAPAPRQGPHWDAWAGTALLFFGTFLLAIDLQAVGFACRAAGGLLWFFHGFRVWHVPIMVVDGVMSGLDVFGTIMSITRGA